jgi:hypothetical protein
MVALGDWTAAERARRADIAAADPRAVRNATLGRLGLAIILARHGDLDEAISLTRPHIVAKRSESGRVRELLGSAVTAIGQRGPRRGQEFARWAHAVSA